VNACALAQNAADLQLASDFYWGNSALWVA
jgi:hypothetical protein